MQPRALFDIYALKGIVLFAGAGCSVAAPSSLPGWYDLNDMLLEALWDKMESYGIKTRHREKLLGDIKARRNQNLFPPDYQAQLMSEKAGIKYFQLLGAVDSDSYNAVHYHAACLGHSGIIKAIVTTNFDRNFERALTDREVPFKVYFDEQGFNSIPQQQQGREVAIIKIHGCCSSPESMVDTRKQRLKGRSKALTDKLRHLLKEHHFVFAGFSGADLDHDPNYLGLQDAAKEAIGFTFLNFPGSTVRESVKKLVQAYSPRATVHDYDAAVFLRELMDCSYIRDPVYSPEDITSVSIREKIKQKVNEIEALDAVNMLVALAESYGDELTSRYLYDKVWHNRYIKDYQGNALPVFLQHYGQSYVFNFQDKAARAAAVGIEIAQWSDAEPELMAYYTHPARMSLFHHQASQPVTVALRALMHTYAGEPGDFDNFPLSMQHSLDNANPMERADMYYCYSQHARIHGLFEEGISCLDAAIKDMELEHDEPRLSLLLGRRAILKAGKGDMSGAHDALKAVQLSEIYKDPRLDAEATLAVAVWLGKQGKHAEAYRYLSDSGQVFDSLKRLPQFLENSLEILEILLQMLDSMPEHTEVMLETADTLINVAIGVIEQGGIYALQPRLYFLGGLLRTRTSPVEMLMGVFSFALTRAEELGNMYEADRFRKTLKQMGILEQVENDRKGDA